MVLTLDGQQDVNIANASELDAAMSDGQHQSNPPEPIFKLEWSGFANSDDPRGGDTVLTVLGGLKHGDVPGITAILLPAFNPPEPPALAGPSTSTTLHPNIRTAMRQSVTPKDIHTYSTVGTPQDFLLLPRESPHFSGSWDPYGILLLSDGDKESRATEAYEFPPPSFDIYKTHKPAPTSPKPESESAEDALSDEIASTLESMKLNEDPKSIEVPPALWSGPIGVTSGAFINVERDSYETLISGNTPVEGLKLRGGAAWVDDDDNQQKFLRVSLLCIMAAA